RPTGWQRDIPSRVRPRLRAARQIPRRYRREKTVFGSRQSIPPTGARRSKPVIDNKTKTSTGNAMSNAPHFDIDVAAFWADPYPDMAKMRKEAPIAFVPQLGSTVFTRRDDIFSQEKRIDVFSSHQPAGLMNTLMGHNMMRNRWGPT